MRTLLSFIHFNPEIRTPKNCDIINLSLWGDRYIYGKYPPCWRDFMMMKVGGMLEFVMQGIMVVQF